MKKRNMMSTETETRDEIVIKPDTNMFLQNLSAEIINSDHGIEAGKRKFEELLQTADRIVITFICDDSRVFLPTEIVDGTLYIPVSAIGGFVPSEAVLRGVLEELKDHSDKLSILLTQHGSSAEVDACLQGKHAEKCTCGARNLIQDINVGNKRTSDIPQALLDQATNQKSGMMENAQVTKSAVDKMLVKLGWNKIPVEIGYYDHNHKKMIVGDENDRREVNFQNLAGYKEWDKAHQDPQALVISFGRTAAIIPDGLLLGQTVGRGENNDFNSTAVSTEDLGQKFFGDMWYAISHHAEPHHGDENFKSSDRIIILADNADKVNQAKQVIGELNTELDDQDQKKIRQAYKNMIAQAYGGVFVVNIEDKSVEFVEVN